MYLSHLSRCTPLVRGDNSSWPCARRYIVPGSTNLKSHFAKSVSSFAETSGREEKHKLTIQSPVVCPAPPHLGRIFVKTRKQMYHLPTLTYFVQTMLLVTFGLSWHCHDRWSVAPQFVHGGSCEIFASTNILDING